MTGTASPSLRSTNLPKLLCTVEGHHARDSSGCRPALGRRRPCRSGHQRTAGGGARFRLNEHVAASATLTRNHIRLPNGLFAANLVGMRLDWSFTPTLFVNAFVQYNGAADAWLSNIRFNLIHRPLSDIYVVWNETRIPGDTRRAVLFKYTHLIAF